MLWMVTNAIDQLVWLQFASANIMDGCEQRKSGREPRKVNIVSPTLATRFVQGEEVVFTWLPFLCF